MRLSENFDKYKDRLFFAFIGLTVAALLLLVGFWKTVLILLFTGAGYAVGKCKDEDKDIYMVLGSVKAFFDR